MLSLGQALLQRSDFLFGHRFHFRIGEHFLQIDKLRPHRLNLGSDLGHRFEFGIITARLDEVIAFKLARRHPRLELGEAVGDLVEAFGWNLHGQPRIFSIATRV